MLDKKQEKKLENMTVFLQLNKKHLVQAYQIGKT